MGGRGSATPKAGADKIGGTARTTTKAPSAKSSTDEVAESVYSRSVKSMTKGLTQEKLKKLSRSQLEQIALTQATKSHKATADKWTKGGITVSEAFSRAVATIPNQTTAQLRQFVWKNRNMD